MTNDNILVMTPCLGNIGSILNGINFMVYDTKVIKKKYYYEMKLDHLNSFTLNGVGVFQRL